MKHNIILFLLSLGYTVLPALFISLGIGLLTGQYLSTFLVSLGLVFIFGILSNDWIQNRTLRQLSILELKKKEIDNQQSVEVTCSYCKARNIIPVKLSNRNTFDCKECKKTNLIIFSFATAIITEPLKLPQLGEKINV
jgi:hypothetical protein